MFPHARVYKKQTFSPLQKLRKSYPQPPTKTAFSPLQKLRIVAPTPYKNCVGGSAKRKIKTRLPSATTQNQRHEAFNLPL